MTMIRTTLASISILLALALPAQAAGSSFAGIDNKPWRLALPTGSRPPCSA